jgi:hypothetical protein
MAAGNTYVPIATTTLGSASSSVTLSSIPATYTDIVIVCNGQTTSGTFDTKLQVNSDTGTNYSSTRLEGSGSAASSNRTTSATSGTSWNTSLGNQTAIIYLNNYSNTTTYKTLLARGGNPAGYLSADVTLWRSTAAINSVTIFLSGAGTFSTGYTFSVYGIAAA